MSKHVHTVSDMYIVPENISIIFIFCQWLRKHFFVFIDEYGKIANIINYQNMKKILPIIVILLIFVGLSWYYRDNYSRSKVLSTINQLGKETEFNIDAQAFQVKTDQSEIRWQGGNSITRKKHYGLVNLKSGWLSVKDQRLIGGEFIVDMMTITNQSLTGESQQKLITHLSGDDFFAVEQYPESRLVLTAVNMVGDEYWVSGNLTIKNITQNITFPAKLAINDQYISAQADFSIDRTQWGVKYGSNNFFSNLGDKAIDDEINFQINIQAVLTPNFQLK